MTRSEIYDKLRELDAAIQELLAPSRPRSLALTKLEECELWLGRCKTHAEDTDPKPVPSKPIDHRAQVEAITGAKPHWIGSIPYCHSSGADGTCPCYDGKRCSVPGMCCAPSVVCEPCSGAMGALLGIK